MMLKLSKKSKLVCRNLSIITNKSVIFKQNLYTMPEKVLTFSSKYGMVFLFYM